MGYSLILNSLGTEEYVRKYANGSISGLLVANGPYELHCWLRSRLSD